jgi:hypothetical protein
MAATLEIHFLMLKYTHCQFCQNYPKKVAKIKLILAKLAFATNYEVCIKSLTWENSKTLMNVLLVLSSLLKTHKKAKCLLIAPFHTLQHECNYNEIDPLEFQRFVILQHHHLQIPLSHIFISKRCPSFTPCLVWLKHGWHSFRLIQTWIR